MPRKKKKETEEGAPAWMVTYGDMMTLLLCFFVIIVALSEIKEDEKYRAVVESLREAFGYRGGVGTVPSEIPPDVSPRKRELAQLAENIRMHLGESTDESQEGRHTAVKRIREGMLFTIGGVSMFEKGRADLLPAAHDPLLSIAKTIRGLRLKVELRGHTCKAPSVDPRYRDNVDLSYARARAVYDFLVGTGADRGRIDKQRLSVSGRGSSEPLVTRAYKEVQMRQNDRVEIIVTEALVEEYQGEPADAIGDKSLAGAI